MDKEHLIAAYFSNTLSDSDKELFDQLLQSDAEFLEEVAFQQRVQQTVYHKENQKLKRHLKDIEKSLERKQINPKRKLWLVAASITLLVALSYYFDRDPSYDKLFATYYKPATNIVHPIVRSGDENTIKTEAFIAYANKEYGVAHEKFDNLYEQSKDSEILFYDAITLLEIDSTATAIKKLKLHQTFEDALSERTLWYLALAYLKNNEIEKSKEQLKLIISSKNYNHDRAKQLLKELD